MNQTEEFILIGKTLAKFIIQAAIFCKKELKAFKANQLRVEELETFIRECDPELWHKIQETRKRIRDEQMANEIKIAPKE